MASTNLPIPVLASTVCISTAAALASFWLWKKSQQVPIPKKWVKVGTVKKLVIYPIKACQGIEINEAVMTCLGLKFIDTNIRDRDFLLVDKDGKRLNMVNFPKMAWVKVEIEGSDVLVLSAPDMATFRLTRPEPNGKNLRTCTIKLDTNLRVLDCGDEAANWFRTFLGNEHVRLVYHHLNKAQRTLDPLYQTKCPRFGLSDVGSFQNATSYLVVTQESIDKLNTKLDSKVTTWKTFRPTIFIEGVSEPNTEINWSFVKIGQEPNAVLNVAAPCHRCLVTHVNQEEGVLTQDGEPMKTLREMKLHEQLVDERLRTVMKNKSLLGLRCGLHVAASEGAMVHVGDAVYAALL